MLIKLWGLVHGLLMACNLGLTIGGNGFSYCGHHDSIKKNR